MIDEKKIEEALNQYIGDDSIYDFGLFVKGFKAGINWFLGNLWHDASEEPKEIENLIVELKDGEIYSAYRVSKYIYITNVEDGCEISVGLNEITRWFYISDLLKGGSNG